MSEIGKVYGAALYTLARQEGLHHVILCQLNVLRESFSTEPGFLRLLSLPNLPRKERCRILDNCFRGKAAPYLLNFLKILSENGYIRYFSDCVKTYRQLYNRDNGILRVTAVTAVPMTRKQKKALTGKLKNIAGQQIALVNQVDPDVLGGVRLDYNGKRVDDTVSHRLEAFRSRLQRAVF